MRFGGLCLCLFLFAIDVKQSIKQNNGWDLTNLIFVVRLIRSFIHCAPWSLATRLRLCIRSPRRVTSYRVDFRSGCDFRWRSYVLFMLKICAFFFFVPFRFTSRSVDAGAYLINELFVLCENEVEMWSQKHQLFPNDSSASTRANFNISYSQWLPHNPTISFLFSFSFFSKNTNQVARFWRTSIRRVPQRPKVSCMKSKHYRG